MLDLTTKCIITSIVTGAGNGGFYIAVSPDGTRGYVAHPGGGGYIAVLDLATNTNLNNDISTGGTPTSIAISADGTRAYVTNVNENTVAVLDLTTNTNLNTDISVGSNPIFILLGP